jgi:hypothetical protein
MIGNYRYPIVTAVLLLLSTWQAGACPLHKVKSKTLSVDWTLAPTKNRLEREAVITLKDMQGQPVTNARIEVNVDMPSMPMAHRVPTAIAEPTSEAGRYLARFTLEMAGEWAALIEVKEPLRTKVVKKFKVH